MSPAGVRKQIRLVIAGSRELIVPPEVIEEHIRKAFGDLVDIIEVVSGTCRGVDKCGEAWAVRAKIPVKRFEPDWDKLPIAAGNIRNRKMAEYADAAIVFMKIGAENKGSKSMVKEMKRKGKRYHTILI